MRRNDRSLEPFLAMGLFLMLVESWLHSDPGHYLESPLRRLLRFLRAEPPSLAEAAIVDARRDVRGEAVESQADDPDVLVDSVAAQSRGRGMMRLSMPTRAKSSPGTRAESAGAIRDRHASADASAAGQKAAAPLKPPAPSAGQPVRAQATAAGGVANSLRESKGEARRIASAAGFAPVKGSSTVAAAVQSVRRRLAEDPSWDGAKTRSRQQHPVSAARGVGENEVRAGVRGIAVAAKKLRGKSDRAPARRTPVSRPLVRSVQELIGAGALKPPSGALHPPDFDELLRRKPSLTNGSSLPDAGRIERLSPPNTQSNYRDWLLQDAGKSAARWHEAGDVRYLHEKPLWAAETDGRRAPMALSGGHWWTVADGSPPLVWQEGRWWWQKDGTWFLLHQGQPWAYRWFADWEREGLFDAKTGTRIVYSADDSKAAVSVPGERTMVFDLRTGQELVSAGEPQAESTSRRPPVRKR